MTETTRFLYELGLLKRYPRTGWLQLGVRTPESVADHSFRASVVATVLASAEGADPQRAAFLALWHDSQETRTTDLPHLAQRYVTSAPHEQITEDQVRPLPAALARLVRAAVQEYEAGRRRKRAAPGTRTSWRCCSRPASTKPRGTATCSPSSIPP